MKRRLLTFVCRALFVCAAYTAAPACVRAQGEQDARLPDVVAAEKFDEFGDLRHCDRTARYDNFAVSLQSQPNLRGYILSHDAAAEPENRAAMRLKLAHQYLVYERHIDPARLVSIRTGKKAAANALTELWVAPEGAPPPFNLPEPEDPAKEFSGKLETYTTDESYLGAINELGPSMTDYAMAEFAEKMKRQPQSRGYLRVRTSAGGVPGGWRRIARRDLRTLQTQYGLDPSRLKVIDAGYTEGETAEVELWILPADAPEPPGLTEKLTRKLTEPVNLDHFDVGDGPQEEQAEWALENLAEQLRDDPHARACIIARRYEEVSDEAEDGAGAEAEGHTPAGAEAAEGVGVSSGDERADVDAFAVAEGWKKLLIEKYGIEAHRLFVMLGRPQQWSGSVQTWLVPSEAPLPDPLAVTEDAEEEVTDEEEGGGDAAAPPPPPA